MSARVTSRGLPGVHTSARAWSARRSMSASLMPSSERCWGMPTSMARSLTALQAATAASSSLRPSTFTPMARAISRYLLFAAGALNSIREGSNRAFATP